MLCTPTASRLCGAALLLAMSCVALAAAEPAKSPLDGRVFVIEIVSPDGDKTTDELRFQNGGFLHSKAYFDLRFSPGKATITGAADKQSFSAVMDNGQREGAKARWEGTVTGDSIQGTLTVTMRGTEKLTFSGHKGELPAAAPAAPAP